MYVLLLYLLHEVNGSSMPDAWKTSPLCSTAESMNQKQLPMLAVGIFKNACCLLSLADLEKNSLNRKIIPESRHFVRPPPLLIAVELPLRDYRHCDSRESPNT